MVMIFPFATFKLAQDGEFQFMNTRVFTITQKDVAGVGFQTDRSAREPATCQQTTLRFLLWEGESDSSVACYCEDGIERIPDGRSCVSP